MSRRVEEHPDACLPPEQLSEPAHLRSLSLTLDQPTMQCFRTLELGCWFVLMTATYEQTWRWH